MVDEAGHHRQTGSRGQARGMRRTAIICVSVVAAMIGLSYASVPLYRMFCEATGFDGTPRIATKPSDTVVDRTIRVRFDANTAQGLPWTFEAAQSFIDVKLGENALIFYRATNTSDKPVTGMATFNVVPEQSAPFFAKVQCFCFTEQTLEPGQSIDMPVSFYVDPAIAKDKDAHGTTHITLSYTFNPVAPKPGMAEKRSGAAG